MLRFSFKLTLFCLLLLLGHNLLSYGYTGLVLTRTLLIRNERDFRAYTAPIDRLVLGDSHAAFAVDPDLLGDSYNFAANAENGIQTYYKFETLINQEPARRPAVVLLPLDLHSFASYRADRFNDNYYYRHYINYLELGQFKGDVPHYLGLQLEGMVPYLGAWPEALNFLNGQYERRSLRHGLILSEGQFSRRPDAAANTQARVDLFANSATYLDPDLAAYFQRLLQLAAAHDIQVVLVRYPVTAEYYTLASTVMDIDAYYTAVSGYIDAAGVNNVVILDYQQAYFGRNELFTDADHLNVDGARLFTAQLRTDLAGGDPPPTPP